MTTHLAIDIGASGGKAFIGEISPERLTLTEAGRFPNNSVEMNGRLRWDIRDLLDSITRLILAVLEKHPAPLDSVSFDTWGVDYGLISDKWNLVEWPVAYRDPLCSSTVDEVRSIIPHGELFSRTGIQHLPFNTIFQLHAATKDPSGNIFKARKMLLMPGLLAHFFSGTEDVDAGIASTTQLVDIATGEWAYDIIERLGIPAGIFPDIIPAGKSSGEPLVSPMLSNMKREVSVLNIAGHDTAAAVAAFDLGRDGIYLSTGSWFLAGCISDKPIISDEARRAGLTNERAVDGRFRILKNVTGLYLMEECRRAWSDEGAESDTVKLVAMASAAKPFGPLIDPDDPSLAVPGDMPRKIAGLIEASGQAVPDDNGAMLRCIFESIAVKSAIVLADICDVAGITPSRLHIGGGGARNELLCNMLAGATGLNAIAGPVEAAAVGNIIAQAAAMGSISSIGEGARIAAESFSMKTYEPSQRDAWDEAKQRYLSIYDDQ